MEEAGENSKSTTDTFWKEQFEKIQVGHIIAMVYFALDPTLATLLYLMCEKAELPLDQNLSAAKQQEMHEKLLKYRLNAAILGAIMNKKGEQN